MHLPFRIGGFTDFMCADVHVENACSFPVRLVGQGNVTDSIIVQQACWGNEASRSLCDATGL